MGTPSVRKPDFFIVGAPKCGTTSLADWLGQHPQILMSRPKEPHYFNTDSAHHAALDLAHYESFFRGAEARHLAVGEASVWYLASHVAAQNILRYQPCARMIVCIRNPIEMAVSLHDQKLFTGDEDIRDFVSAWNAQERRRRGQLLPPVCTDVRHFLYGESCRLGMQLSRLYSQVGQERVHVVVMDDLRADPGMAYRAVLRHLEVPDDGRMDFSASNRAKERRWPWVRTLQRRLHVLKGRMGVKVGTGMFRLISEWNRRERTRPPMTPTVRTMLADYFREDIIMLEHLLARSFRHWMNG